MKRLSGFTLFALAVATAASLAFAYGSTALASSANASAHPAATHTSTSAKATMATVDINSASKEELMTVPGIGDAIADKIIAGRPFKMKSELVSKGIVTKGVYAKFSRHLIAKQSK